MRSFLKWDLVWLMGIFFAFIFLLLGCVTETTFEEESELQENLPPIPLIKEIIAGADEPNRVMQLLIDFSGNNNEIDGFSLQRKVQGGNFTHIANLPPHQNIYNDVGVEKSTTYTYRIRSFNNFGNSEWYEKTQTSLGSQKSELVVEVSADTFVKESSPNTNYGDRNYIMISGSDPGIVGESLNHALVNFSLPNLPSYANYESSWIYLLEASAGNVNYPGPITIYAGAILNQWDEFSVTWNNRPGTLLSTDWVGSHDPNNTRRIAIDVTGIVFDWYKGVRSNLGILLFSGTENAYCSYYSREGYAGGSATLLIEYSW